jgi:hypothetical protein
MFDLLAMVRALCKSRGLDPSDYSETLYSANGKRWGNASILRKKGMGIDVIFQEFQWHYPRRAEASFIKLAKGEVTEEEAISGYGG